MSRYGVRRRALWDGVGAVLVVVNHPVPEGVVTVVGQRPLALGARRLRVANGLPVVRTGLIPKNVEAGLPDPLARGAAEQMPVRSW